VCIILVCVFPLRTVVDFPELGPLTPLEAMVSISEPSACLVTATEAYCDHYVYSVTATEAAFVLSVSLDKDHSYCWNHVGSCRPMAVCLWISSGLFLVYFLSFVPGGFIQFCSS